MLRAHPAKKDQAGDFHLDMGRLHSTKNFILHVALPMDLNMNILIASKCMYYMDGNVETTNHLLLHGTLARYVWLHFNSLFGLTNPVFYSIKSIFQAWADHGQGNSLKKMCYTLAPILILWEILKERNHARNNDSCRTDMLY